MVDWQVTATTIICEFVDDEVTLIVSGDGTVRCTGRQKYEKPEKEAVKLLKMKSISKGEELKCQGASCAVVTQYREKMMGE